jgi:hypothetical protein
VNDQWFGTYPVPGVVHAIEAQVVADETGFLVQRVVFGGDFVDASLGIRHVAAIENGDEIIPLNNGLNGPVRALYAHGEGRLSVLVAAGEFTETASQTASRLARLDGTAISFFSFEASRQAWSPIEEGMNAPALAITTFQGSLVVGGQFSVAGAEPASGLARFSAAAPLPECPGDTNGDGTVNFTDLNAVLSTFGQIGDAPAGDVNGDGAVNFADLNLVLSNFGVDCQR